MDRDPPDKIGLRLLEQVLRNNQRPMTAHSRVRVIGSDQRDLQTSQPAGASPTAPWPGIAMLPRGKDPARLGPPPTSAGPAAMGAIDI